MGKASSVEILVLFCKKFCFALPQKEKNGKYKYIKATI